MGNNGGGTGKWEKFIPAELGVREAIEEGVRMVGPKKWFWRLVVWSPASSFTFTTALQNNKS